MSDLSFTCSSGVYKVADPLPPARRSVSGSVFLVTLFPNEKDPNGVEHPLNQRRFMERCIVNSIPRGIPWPPATTIGSVPFPGERVSPREMFPNIVPSGMRESENPRIPSRQAQFGARFWLPWVDLDFREKRCPSLLLVCSSVRIQMCCGRFYHKIFFHGDILSQ